MFINIFGSTNKTLESTTAFEHLRALLIHRTVLLLTLDRDVSHDEARTFFFLSI